MVAQYSTPSSQLFGGPPRQSYGAFPPNDGPSDAPPPYSPRYAAPGPTDPYPRPPLSPELPSFSSRPAFLPAVVPTRNRTSKSSKGLVFWLVIVLLQIALITYRSDTLAERNRLESAASSASRELSALVVARRKSEHEREKMRHERELWKKVPEDYVPPGAYWKPIWPVDHCREYGKREYWGMLLDIPEGWSAMDACMNTPAEVNGVTIRRPHRCAFVDGFPHIHGYWMVDWGQQDCKPWHKDIRNTGCTNHRSGLTRIEAVVEGILHKKDQDWRVMCESTPFTWDGFNYTTPRHCEERGLGGCYKVAMWDVPAERCQ